MKGESAMRDTFISLTDYTVSNFTLNPKIYALQIRKETRKEWLIINYSDWFDLREWTIVEAIEYYVSPQGESDRFDAWYRAWCD